MIYSPLQHASYFLLGFKEVIKTIILFMNSGNFSAMIDDVCEECI